jgi:hypothetical protein
MSNTAQVGVATPANTDTVLGNANGLTALFTMAGLVAALGLGNVENTALSTWAGSTNLNTFAPASVQLSHMQNRTGQTLLGRYSATAGVPQEITLGANLTLDATTGVLSASGGGGSGNYTPTGTGATARGLDTKIGEIQVSIKDYGADSTGATACDTAWTNALATGAHTIYFPPGSYRFNNTITTGRSVKILGAGREFTFLKSYVSGNNHGMVVSAPTGGDLIQLAHFDFGYYGTGQTSSTYYCGIFIQRKVDMEHVYVHDFTNDGAMFAPSNANVASGLKGTIGNAVFFSSIRNSWFKDNGRHGFWVRMGANANTFINCQFDRNGTYGFYHFLDGPDDNAATASTYGTLIIAGQASYNGQEGYRLESGTNVGVYWIYGEYNGSPSHTNTDGYTNTSYDVYVGDNLSRSWVQIGVLFNASSTHVRMPASNTTSQVWSGGQPLSTHIPKRAATFSSISSPDATAAAGSTPTKTEFDKVVTLVNELKADFNTMRTNAQAANLFA